MEIDDSLLLERITGRRVHKNSGRSYHIKFNPPKVDGVDDITGEPLIQRPDDNEETMKTRLEAFHAQTKPIIGHYTNFGVVTHVDAASSMDKVWSQIHSAFQ